MKILNRLFSLSILPSILNPITAQESTKSYQVNVKSIQLNDLETSTPDIAVIHNNVDFEVVAGLTWAEDIYVESSTNELTYEMTVDGKLHGAGVIDLNESRALPTIISCGSAVVDTSGSHTIGVTVKIDESTSSNEEEYQSFVAGVSFIPLIIILLFAATTHKVELSLGLGIFCGACMVAGSLTAGFRDMLDTYILGALADEDHCYVMLFILFMAGLVGLIEKSGGLLGITEALKSYVKSARSAQGATFLAGVVVFFDDYANCLVAGSSMKPLADACGLSREKLAFLVDATAAPIASIVPISSWVGFEIGLIQKEVDAVYNLYTDPTIDHSGFGVFLETIKYRYYCIFMLFFIPLIILSGKDFGPMLISERLNAVYGRTDGGEGALRSADGHVQLSHNAPGPDVPKKFWNMAFPIVTLVFYIFYLLIWTGQDPSNPNQTFVETMENSSANPALVWGTMAACLTSVLFYFVQDYKDGRIIWFNAKGWFNRVKRGTNKCCNGSVSESNEEEEVHAQVLLPYDEALCSFIIGMEKVFGCLVVLVLAWSSGAIMKAVGLNRLFGAIVTNPNFDFTILPTLSFVISVLIAFSTGTSFGTMSIMFPLIMVPSYEASNGDPVIFYSVAAGILAGSVAGDHASPISDTTVLASIASECTLINHVKTQAPYAFMVSIWSILLGTLPTGKRTISASICILLGFIAMAVHAFVTASRPIEKSGRFDVFTEAYLLVTKNEFLSTLKEQTKQVAETGETLALIDKSAHVVKVPEGSDDELETSDDGSMVHVPLNELKVSTFTA